MIWTWFHWLLFQHLLLWCKWDWSAELAGLGTDERLKNLPKEEPQKEKTEIVLSSVIPVVQSQRGGQKCALPGEAVTYKSMFLTNH